MSGETGAFPCPVGVCERTFATRAAWAAHCKKEHRAKMIELFRFDKQAQLALAALDTLALALADHAHTWKARQRKLYTHAVAAMQSLGAIQAPP